MGVDVVILIKEEDLRKIISSDVHTFLEFISLIQKLSGRYYRFIELLHLKDAEIDEFHTKDITNHLILNTTVPKEIREIIYPFLKYDMYFLPDTSPRVKELLKKGYVYVSSIDWYLWKFVKEYIEEFLKKLKE